MRQILYVIGAPGSGKTTLVEKALAGCASSLELKPFAVRWYPEFGQNSGVQLGKARREFGGTDTLSMSVQPLVIEWMKMGFNRCIIGEGDRLTSGAFFDACFAAGWELTVVHLDTPKELTQARCTERGSTQNEQWMTGRRTKVERLAKKYCTKDWVLDGRLPVDELALQLREHPVIDHIREIAGGR